MQPRTNVQKNMLVINCDTPTLGATEAMYSPPRNARDDDTDPQHFFSVSSVLRGVTTYPSRCVSGPQTMMPSAP